MNEPEAAVWMSRLADPTRGGDALPDPAAIWWKARLLERQAAQARALRPTAIAQWASLAAAVIGMIALCTANWPGIRGMLEPFGMAPWMALAGGAILMGVALRVVFGE
ncbi:MAG: hypothetical protein ABSC93_23425 [Bryobacteraceae bacterium]|jgi:hypothetical protein